MNDKTTLLLKDAQAKKNGSHFAPQKCTFWFELTFFGASIF